MFINRKIRGITILTGGTIAGKVPSLFELPHRQLKAMLTAMPDLELPSR